MDTRPKPSASLARSITLAGSRQTFLTIQWLVDRDLAADAFRAYAYFRWVDDTLDEAPLPREQRLTFVARQKQLMERLFRGERPTDLSPEEEMLSALVRCRRREHGGLTSYLRNMMAVMEFDARRRGRLVSGDEIEGYTRLLSVAVMDGLTYFIAHRYCYPESMARYSAVAGAHVSHMLRDAAEDVEAGYYNVPREVLEASRISARDIRSPVYLQWVRQRVGLARHLLREGRGYIHQLHNLRARIAGLAYCARFEAVLAAIERDGCVLHAPGELPEVSGSSAAAARSRQPERGLR